MISADLANNSNGYVTVIGLLSNMDTSAFTDGAQLYLSGTTAGAYTSTKTYAPIHLVYIGFVEYAHPTQGKIFVKVQNGYELDEIHNVSARTPTTGQTIVWNGATNLWEQNTVSLAVGVNGTLPVANGGTGGTAFTGYLYGNGTGAMTAATTIPTTALSGTITNAQLANSAITINGTSTSLGGTISVGTVTSVTATSPVVSTGGTTPVISLATAYGDTLNPYASKTANYILAAPNGVAGVPLQQIFQR
jgi:peptidyl-tRNA hydrolase